MKEYYIFDLDGTLIDSMPVGVGISLDFLDEQGISYPPDIVKTLTPLGMKGVARYYVENLGAKFTAEEVCSIFRSKQRSAYAESIPLKSKVEETLKILKSQGHSLNILTACPREFIKLSLHRLGVYDLFNNIWTIDDFGMSKAEEAIYIATATRLGVRVSDCIMVDDNVNVLKTAKRVGMATIGVYDEASANTESEMREIADSYVFCLSEILK